MSPIDYQLLDVYRWFFGILPAWFMLECALRIAFLYCLLLCCLRLIGSRLPSLLTRNEMAALVSLAAMIGIPMQSPDKGLLPALIVAITIVGLHRLVSFLAIHYRLFEKVALDQSAVIVSDGRFMLKALKSARLSREMIVEQLRSRGLNNLGLVKRLYLEPDGRFSLQQQSGRVVGLCLIPQWDLEMRQRQVMTEEVVCRSCGELAAQAVKAQHCPRCHRLDWEYAYANRVQSA